jgi:hypothetical protein
MANVKINTKALDALSQEVRETARKAVSDKKLLFKQGEEIKKDLRFQYGRGKRLDPIRGVLNQQGLEKSTIKNREYLERAGNAGKLYKSPSKSNISMSGQFLNSFFVKVNPRRAQIKVAPNDKLRRGYKSLSGEIIQGTDQVTNKEVGDYLNDLGFFNAVVRFKVKQRIARNLSRAIVKAINKIR